MLPTSRYDIAIGIGKGFHDSDDSIGITEASLMTPYTAPSSEASAVARHT